MDDISLGSCPVMGFGISDVEFLVSSMRESVNY
jgi:hypothetical protein